MADNIEMTLDTLPDNIKKLEEKQRKKWMNVYNLACSNGKKKKEALEEANKSINLAEDTKKYRKNNLPERIAQLNEDLQGQWLSVYKAMLSQGKSDSDSEKLATFTIQRVLQESLDSLYTMQEFKLSDNNNLEVMRIGKWEHPLYGNLKISESDIDGFIKSFDDKVRGVDIAIDLEHGETDKKGAAAGWIKSLTKSKDNKSLMAFIEWTDLGKEVIEKEEYKYFSPEFKFNYTDTETGKTFKNVLLGGGLTNRPFIKNMQPVLLSEDIINKLNNKDHDNNVGGKKDMDLTKVREVLKLSEDVTEEKIIDKIIKLKETEIKLTEAETKLTTLLTENEALKGTKTDLEKKVLKLDEDVKKVTLKLDSAEWHSLSTKALSEGRLTPSIMPKYKALFEKDKETAIDLINTMPVLVQLDEVGSKRGKGENEKDPIKLFEDQVNKIMNERKITYEEALVFTEKEHVKLFNDFEKARHSYK